MKAEVDTAARLEEEEEEKLKIKDVMTVADKKDQAGLKLAATLSQSSIPDEERYFITKTKFSLDRKNEIVEDKFYEFKNFLGPTLKDDQRSEISRTICGFLNAEGGRLYIGIDDFGSIVGIEMGRKKYDEFKTGLTSAILNRITPHVENSQFEIDKRLVFEQESDSKVTLRLLIEITVLKGEQNIYFVKKGLGDIAC